MTNWISIRKGVSTCHVEFDNFWTDLFISTTKYRVTSQGLEVSVDLGKNLRTRNKGENTYIDCVRLRSNVDALKTVQIHDEALARTVITRSRGNFGVHVFRLNVALDGDHWFRAKTVPGNQPLTIQLAAEIG